jgi:hypothetical protein
MRISSIVVPSQDEEQMRMNTKAALQSVRGTIWRLQQFTTPNLQNPPAPTGCLNLLSLF